ncbi:MAG: hypothetical protein J5911_05190 [Clostridia bacterium]|nr:hypothetical protein [Clostridia bacterium]
MKNVLILGLGGSGGNVADCFFNNICQNDRISFLNIDSDIEGLKKFVDIPTICLTDYTLLGNVIEILGKDTISEWFPCEDTDDKLSFFKTLEMGRGAGGWRMKGLLSFEYMLSDSRKFGAFLSSLDRLIDKKDENTEIEIIIVSSMVGGTGSALFLPVAFFIKRYFEQRYNKKICIKGFLACPEVYSGHLTAENRVKAFANAYAVASEINAVDLVSKGYNAKADAESKCKISFKIGSEKSKGIGVLFDSKSDEYAVLSAQPFKRVYLFDRVPGIDTISENERIMSRILSFIIEDEPEDGCSDIYAGISIAEAVYPFESVLDYVAKKKVFDDMEHEWLALYNEAQEESEATRGKDEILNFARNFTGTYKRIYTTSFYSQYLALGREKVGEDIISECDGKEPIIQADYIRDYLKILIDESFSLFEDNNAKAIDEALKNQDKEISVLSIFDGKNKKNKKLIAVQEKAKVYFDLLTERYKTGIRTCKDFKNAVRDRLIDPKNENSIFNKIINYQGKYLHPVTALLLLCDLYEQIHDMVVRADGFHIINESFEERDLSDDVFSFAKPNQDVNEAYAQLGEARLKVFAQTETDKLSVKLVNAFSDIKRDLYDTNQFMVEQFSLFCLDQVLSVVGDIISRYVDMLKMTPSIMDGNKVDVKLALIANTVDSCTKMNVGCSETVKEKAYAFYTVSETNEYQHDEYTGRIFYDYALNRDDKEDIFYSLVAEERENVAHDPAFKRILDLDIFRVLHDSDILKESVPEKTQYNDLKKAFSLVALPLDIAIKADKTKDKTKVITNTLVPTEAVEFAKQMLHGSDLSAQDIVYKYLYSQGIFDTSISVSEVIPRNRIFATKKIYDFELSLFNKLNESVDGANYYRNYVKALGVKKEQSTQMWNPRLVKEKPSDFLPFIDPVKREKFEKNIYKAAFYMLFSGRIFVGQNDDGHDILFYIEKDKKEIVRCQGKTIEYKNPEMLFDYIKENVELAELFGGAWDRETEKEISTLPVIGFEKTDAPKLKEAILSSTVIKFLTEDIMSKVRSEKDLKSKNVIDLIAELSDDEHKKAEAINIARMLSELIRYMIDCRPLSDEMRSALFKDVIVKIKDDYERKAKDSDRKSYKKNSVKAFDFLYNKNY